MGGLFGGGKSKEPPVPEFAPSEIRYGDTTLGRVYKDGNSLVAQYLPTPQEQQAKSYSENRINQLLPTLGQTDPEMAKVYQQTRDDFINQQTGLFNRDYDKTLRGLREDIGSRFGTLKASPYFDKLGELERDVRAPAYTDIEQRGSLLQNDLVNQDQSRKLQELSALGYQVSSDQANFLNSLTSTGQQSNQLNQFNQNQYTQKLQAEQQRQAQRQNSTNGFLNFIGGIASAALGA